MHTKCPKCQKILQVNDNMVGKHVKCPICSQIFSVPKSTSGTQEKKNLAKTAQLLELIASAKNDIEKSLDERDEAMELVDSYFQLFLQRAEQSGLSPEEQQEYRDIAQNLFQLQKKFPLLSGFRDIFSRCEKTLRELG